MLFDDYLVTCKVIKVKSWAGTDLCFAIHHLDASLRCNFARPKANLLCVWLLVSTSKYICDCVKASSNLASTAAVTSLPDQLFCLYVCRRDSNQASAGAVIGQPPPAPLSDHLIPSPSSTEAPPACQNPQSGDDLCVADNDSPLPRYKRDLVQKMKILHQELRALQPQTGHCRIEVSREEIFEAWSFLGFFWS